MDQRKKLEIYQAQTANLKELVKAKKQLNLTINTAIKDDNSAALEVNTKLFALLFSAWVEAQFVKTVHTPYGFSLNEISQIMKNYANRAEDGWKKCVELALRKASKKKNSKFLAAVERKLLKIIKDYVLQPRHLRNKIAHGQWVKALNSSNTAVNPNSSNELSSLDVVKISTWFDAYKYLADIIEILIESPQRAFFRDYYTIVTDLDSFLIEARRRSMQEKRKKLLLKYSHRSYKMKPTP